MKYAQSVRGEPTVAGTVQVLVVLSTEEQLEGEGETPTRPGGRAGERKGGGGKGRGKVGGKDSGTQRGLG